MKKISYEDVYSEVYGSDFLSDVRNRACELAMEEEDMYTKLTVEKPLESSILNAEFVDKNKEQLIDYVIRRITAIELLMRKKHHIDPDDMVSGGARDMIYDMLLEIERVHPCIVEYIGEEAFEIISAAQELFIKKLWI